ncbi:hypothetical protein BS78_08G145700 [Paspalum vaginatum]|nr:hypothetical protein BS78_08G145700 [Paspalum vaginatum]
MVSRRPLPALTDELLEEIFLRLGSPADLARASIACVAFRRLIADLSFLRRYRSLHPPPLLGLVNAYGRGFQPAEAPPASAALGRAIGRAADFSFEDYLPRVTGSRWQVRDVRDGRVLMECIPEEGDDDDEEIFFPDLAVCDPLSRRYLLLPPIPDDLLASVQVQKQFVEDFRPFLVPSGFEGTSFRVLVRMDSTERVVTFIFSSADGHWSAGASVSWGDLGIPLGHRRVISGSQAYGCFYWKVVCEDKCLKLDTSSMEFSAVDLPPERDGYYVIIGEAGEGKIGMFSLIDNHTSLCYSIIRQNGGERFDQLKMDNIIPLPVGYSYHIHGSYEGYIIMSGFGSTRDVPNTWFSLEIKTLRVERICQMRFGCVDPYFGFPLSMSQRI